MSWKRLAPCYQGRALDPKRVLKHVAEVRRSDKVRDGVCLSDPLRLASVSVLLSSLVCPSPSSLSLSFAVTVSTLLLLLS